MAMTPTQAQAAQRYIRGIRNPAKRRFAERYWRWLRNGRRGAEPSRPAELSYMGAQAVWMTLIHIADRADGAERALVGHSRRRTGGARRQRRSWRR